VNTGMTLDSLNLVGKQIGDFVVRERIGSGGMAVVYRAYQPSVHRDVALKIIPLSDATRQDDAFQRRFSQEAETIAHLEHIHILPVYDYGIAEEMAYLAMRLLTGGTLDDRLSKGPLDLEQAALLFRQFATGLAYAHQKGVIHRDLKPSNIMLDDAGNALLTDFGLAKIIGNTSHLTKEGAIIGTPAYMSPEQLRGEALDHRCDIYSAGVVFYHMVTGQAPFGGPTSDLVTTIYQHLEKAPQPPRELNPAIPDNLELIILRALRKKPDERYSTIQDMAEDVASAVGLRLGTDQLVAVKLRKTEERLTAAQRSAALRRRRLRFLAAAGAVIAVVIGVALAVLLLGQGDSGKTDSFTRPTLLPGEVAPASESVPTADEIARAQARLGTDGFIAYITCTMETEYHAAQAREVGDFAAQYGLDYRIYDSALDIYTQMTQIEKARAEGAMGLIICPLDPPLLDEPMISAQQAGIALVFMHSDMPSYGGVLLAGDDYQMGLKAGRFAGQLIADERGGQANVIILDYPDLSILVVRANGLEDGLKEFAPEANVIGRYQGGAPELAQESVGKLLDEGVRFDAILSINDAGSFGAITAMEQAGIAPDSVIISSVDAEALAKQYISEGYFMRGSVTVNRQEFSHAAANAMVKLLAGSTLPETYLIPPGEVVTRETLAGE
jgi:ABC-type sugar transport system substrate-binding protein